MYVCVLILLSCRKKAADILDLTHLKGDELPGLNRLRRAVLSMNDADKEKPMRGGSMDLSRENAAARAKAEKYAKILSKTIVNPGGDIAS